MLSELWCHISNYLDIEEIIKLIKLKIISDKYICKICSLDKKIIIDDYIYCKYNFFDTKIGIERTIKRQCGLYINNICSICGHKKNIKIKAKKIREIIDERWIQIYKERFIIIKN